MKRDRVDIRVVRGWEELSQDELEYVFRCIAERGGTLNNDELRVCIALKLAGIQVLDGGKNLVKVNGIEIELTNVEMSALYAEYEWLNTLPETPLRLEVIDGTGAVSPRMENLSFEDYLTADNYYQGMLYDEDESYLDSMTAILYPGIKISERNRKMSRLNTFYWWTSFKRWASRRWSHFLQPVNNEGEQNKFRVGGDTVRDSVNAQIRALTKGDVTKEKEVRGISCHRALTELDALAKESEELKRMKKG